MDDRVVGALVVLFAYIAWKRNIIQNGWGALWGASQRTASTGANTSALMSLITTANASSGATVTGDQWAQTGCPVGNFSCLRAVG